MSTTTDDVTPVVGFWQELGLPGLVDVHTHFIPRSVLVKVWAYFDAAESVLGWAWPIAYRHTEDELLARIRAYGVRAFTSMIYPHKPNMAQWLNGWATDFAARVPDCLRTATFFPEPGAGGYVAAAIEGGARLFKAHVQVGGYDPRDPLLDDVWASLADAGVPVVVHCGSGPAAPGEHTGPGPMAAVLARHPRLPAIIAHMGLPEYREFLDLALRYPQVRLDTTMVFTDFIEKRAPFPERELPLLRELQGKILFGSDFPNIPYPYAHGLQALARLDLGAEWLRAVCYGNAAALFGIDEPPQPG